MRKSFHCIDGHTCGNPVRLVAGGGPVLKGNTIMEKRLDFLERFDWIRRGLMFEPRGHDMMSGSILYPPHSEENDISVLFIETSGCLPMCGHGMIGTVTIMVQEGLVQPKVWLVFYQRDESRRCRPTLITPVLRSFSVGGHPRPRFSPGNADHTFKEPPTPFVLTQRSSAHFNLKLS